MTLTLCVIGEDPWEPLGLQGNPTSPYYKEIEYSLEGLKLKLQYFGHLMQRTDSTRKDPDAGKDWRWEKRTTQRKRWLDGITDLMVMSFKQALGGGDGQGGLACCSPRGRKESDMTEGLNWWGDHSYGCWVLVLFFSFYLSGPKTHAEKISTKYNWTNFKVRRAKSKW